MIVLAASCGDLNFAINNPHLVRLHGHNRREGFDFAGTDVEGRAMQGTLHDVTKELALAE